MTKYAFENHYVGPYGAHLNCRTKFTRTHELKTDGTMHPGRTQFGRGYNPRSARNGERIAQPPQRVTGPRAKASAELDRRRREYSAMSATDQVAFTQPGSMSL
jgi:hypothetical protein